MCSGKPTILFITRKLEKNCPSTVKKEKWYVPRVCCWCSKLSITLPMEITALMMSRNLELRGAKKEQLRLESSYSAKSGKYFGTANCSRKSRVEVGFFLSHDLPMRHITCLNIWVHISQGYWSAKKQYVINDHSLHSNKIGVWCTISAMKSVGPIFFYVDSEVYGQIFIEFLEQLRTVNWRKASFSMLV